MKFWDSSAVVALLVGEESSGEALALLREDRRMVVWWATKVECISALARRVREGTLTEQDWSQALGLLERLERSWAEVEATAKVRLRAERLLRVHTLRAADALQLAAAFVWCRSEPEGREFVCLDDRLREAARKEGFTLMPSRWSR